VKTHLIFDLGGTLIFDPYDGTLAKLSARPLRDKLEIIIGRDDVDSFLGRWRVENSTYNFPFASHFLQEEAWIARAAWPNYSRGSISDVEAFPSWTIEVLQTYRRVALDVIRSQSHLEDLRTALGAARERGYRLSVASNDRYFATAAMLAASDLINLFDFIATSEGLSFETEGAEKPSAIFFEALQRSTGLPFDQCNTYYIGDDETRDIASTKGLNIRTIRFLGNVSESKSWLDNRRTTAADFAFANYSEFLQLINSGVLEQSITRAVSQKTDRETHLGDGTTRLERKGTVLDRRTILRDLAVAAAGAAVWDGILSGAKPESWQTLIKLIPEKAPTFEERLGPFQLKAAKTLFGDHAEVVKLVGGRAHYQYPNEMHPDDEWACESVGV